MLSIFAAAIGAVVGSFASTFAIRHVDGEGAIVGRSRCDGCTRSLNWFETLPIAGYTMTGGRCRTCRQSIDRLHPASEITGAAISALAISILPKLEGVLIASLGLVLLALALIDIKSLRLPNIGTAAAGIICLTLSVLNRNLLEGILAAVGTMAVLLGLKWLLERRQQMTMLGLGDVKLLTGLALATGQWIALTLAFASTLALVAVVLTRRVDKDRLPFGPFIASVGFLVIVLRSTGVLW